MPLLDGSANDLQDEYVVYVYDSQDFPFYRGEAYHQFHPNDVVMREVPRTYLEDLKETQKALGRLDYNGCFKTFKMFAQVLIGCACGCASALLALLWRILLRPSFPAWLCPRKLAAARINSSPDAVVDNKLPSPPPSAPGSDRSYQSKQAASAPYVV